MNRKFYSKVTVLSLAVVVGASSCINKDYRVEELDKSVQIAANGISLPLVTIDRKELQDLIKDQDNLSSDADGYYFSYGGADKKFGFTVDPITLPEIGNISNAIGGMTLSGLSNSIPGFDFEGGTTIDPINFSATAGWPGGGGGLTLGNGIPVPEGLTFSGTQSGSEDIDIYVTVPELIKNVNTVWFGPPGQGALISLKLNLNGLDPVTESVMVDELVLTLPEHYKLRAGGYDAGADVTGDGTNKLTIKNQALHEITKSIEFYIESVDLSNVHIGAGRNLSYGGAFEYSLKYTITTEAGTVSGAGAPQAVITGSPAFHDATFTTEPVDLDISENNPLAYRFGPVPDEVIQLTGVAFENGDINIRLGAFDTPFNPVPNVRVTFPEIFELSKKSTSDAGTLADGVLTVPVTALQTASGYTVVLDNINLTGVTPDNSGKIDLSSYSIGVALEPIPSQTLKWSSNVEGLTIPESANVDVDLSGIEIKSVSGRLNMNFDKELAENIDPIDLSDITKELGDDVNVVANLMPPVITIDVTNPIGITVEASLTLDAKNENGVSIATAALPEKPTDAPLTIAPAIDGIAKRTKIVIADTDDDSGEFRKYENEGYTPYTLDLKNLLYDIPATVDIGFKAGLNPSTIQTIPMNQSFPFDVEYSVYMPLGFGKDMEINLDIEEDGLNDTFKDLADMKIMAADISVSVELTVSFPLKMADAKIWLLKTDGSEIPGLKTTIENGIEGPDPATGYTKTSTLTIRLEVPGGGDFTVLSSIDRLKLTLPVRSTATGDNWGRLKPTDYISGKAYITLAEGISLDLDKL